MKRNDKGVFIKTHEMCKSSEYASWACMKNRCSNPDKKHEKYRSMFIYPKWIESFEEFLKDMGYKPTSKHTIDRIDNSRGYEPDNCRWATRSEQNRNYSLNRNIEYNGEVLCVSDWAEKLNIPRHRIYQRLNRGFSIEKSLFKNDAERKHYFEKAIEILTV